MQLMSIGDAIINLDCVTVIDVDRDPRTGITLKVHGDSKEAVITFRVGPEILTSLLNLVPQQLRFRGVEQEI
jgi:hypothetical protein